MAKLPHVKAVTPSLRYQDFQLGVGNVAVKYGNHKVQHTILEGESPDFAKVNDVALDRGQRVHARRMMSAAPMSSSLGHDIPAEKLFQGQDPINKGGRDRRRTLQCDWRPGQGKAGLRRRREPG